jgi:hypothetical protein
MFWAAVRLTVLTVLAVAGCAAAPAGGGDTGTAAPVAAPIDFSLDVIVRSGPAGAEATAPAGDADRGRSLRPAHYILFCDGSLHWAGSPVPADLRLPPLTRVLDGHEMAELWQLLQQVGYADPAAGVAPFNAKLVEVAAGETYAVSFITGHGERWAHADRREAGGPTDPAMAQVVERLAALVWTGAWTEPEQAGPPRDEFGPDPYARYRRP